MFPSFMNNCFQEAAGWSSSRQEGNSSLRRSDPAGVRMNLADSTNDNYQRQHPMPREKVSILMLTHNAPRYVERSIRTLVRHTRNVDYELVVVDNASEAPTKSVLNHLHKEGLIQHLTLLEYNSFF